MKHSWRMAGLGVMAVVALLVAACGGGGGGTSMATGSSPVAAVAQATQGSGTITGFGSTIIDGVEYDDSLAAITRAIDPAHPVAIAKGDLQLGQQVDITLNASGQLTTVVVVASVIGPIDASSAITCPSSGSGAGSMVIAGQAIDFTVGSASGATVLSGVANCAALAALPAGTILEIHGVLNTQNDHVSATRIQVEPASGTVSLLVRGKVSNAGSGQFQVGQLTVVTNASTTILPAGATISNGEIVRVYASALPSNGTVTATTIQVETAAALDGRTIVRGGLVSVLNSDGTFVVDGITVDPATGKPAITDGSGNTIAASTIAVGDWVRVEGTVTNGVLVAARIEDFKNGSPCPRVLIGSVTNLLPDASGNPVSFDVRGQLVLISASTVFKNGTAASLANGALVTVTGHVTASGITADTIAFDTPPQGVTFTFRGTATAVAGNSTTGVTTFSLDGLDMSTATGTTGSGLILDNAQIDVTGAFNGTLFVVTAVVADTTPVASVSLTGTISCSQVAGSGGTTTADCSTFMLDGATVTVPANVPVSNGPLSDGAQVEVTATIDAAGAVTAVSIQVLGTGSQVHGLGAIDANSVVKNADGTYSFTIGGQAVNTTATTAYSPSGKSGADLMSGALVGVVGSLGEPASGSGPEVITATKVVFL